MSSKSTEMKKSLKTSTSKKKTLFLLSMVAPGAIWLILIRYLPMFGITIAFQRYKMGKPPSLINNFKVSEWVGLENFKFLFYSSESWGMIRNTLGYNILFIILGLVIGVAFAIMLNEITNKFVAKTYQTLMFFPYFLSWVVVSYFVLAFLDPTRGMIPHLQDSLGHTPTDWYNTQKVWPYILIIANVWKNTGYGTILYLAAITGIDGSQYEAASIDGATKWQQIKFITLPHLRPMISILFIMNVGRIFNADFGLFFTVPQNMGTLIPVTQVIDTYVYRTMTATNNMGMSSAAGLIQNIVGFLCIMGANSVVKRIDEDSSLF